MTTTASEDTPVTGQTVLLQVYTLSDHYPVTFSWQADRGILSTSEYNTDNWVYWTAPDTAGTYRVTCTVTDNKDNNTVKTFTLVVRERIVELLYPSSSNLTTALSMVKENAQTIGGVWVSLANGEVHYITSSSDQNAEWTGAFNAMTLEYNPLNATHALWGAYLSDTMGNQISEQSSLGTATITCPFSPPDEIINALVVSFEDPGFYLMVGADSGLYWYHTDGSTEQWHSYTEDYGIGKTTDFAVDEDGIYGYAATTSGIYTFTYTYLALSETPLYSDNAELAGKPSCAVVVDDAGALWHVTDDKVYKDDVLVDPQPAERVCTLAIDTFGWVWCGKYYWRPLDASWQTPIGLVPYNIRKVVATEEGLRYFITDSGALLRY